MGRFPDFEYPNTRRVGYNLGEYEGTAYFLPVCEKCGRYVKMDKSIQWNELYGVKEQPNATCSKCGRVFIGCEMID